MKNPRTYIDIFTDGSSFISKDKKFYEASAGFVVLTNNNVILEGGTYIPDGTNSAGEVRSILLGLDAIHNNFPDLAKSRNVTFRVIGDSDYVLKSLTQYIRRWSLKGRDARWIKSDGQPVMHQEVFKEIYYNYLRGQIDIQFYHINSHLGEPGKKSIEVGWEKFKKRNKMDISLNAFNRLVVYNKRVDKLAEVIRKQRIPQYVDNYVETGEDQCQSNSKPSSRHKIPKGNLRNLGRTKRKK